MMDSMTDEELDSTNPKILTESRIMRIARGSGRLVHEVMEMLEEYKRLAKIFSKMKGLKIPKKGDMSSLSRNMNAQNMSKVLPSDVEADRWNGWFAELNEANGFRQGHDGYVWWWWWRVIMESQLNYSLRRQFIVGGNSM